MPKKNSEEKDTKGVESNEKALKFQSFLVDNNINVFSTESLEDEYETVLFRSRIEVRGQMLPMVIIIDKSVFTIVRTQVVTGIEGARAEKLKGSLNAQPDCVHNQPRMKREAYWETSRSSRIQGKRAGL